MFQPSLWLQTDVIAIGVPSTQIRVDPPLASFLRQVRSTLDAHGYNPGHGRGISWNCWGFCLDAIGAVKGDTIAVVGAAGGVGGFAVQLAALRGLRVIAVTREVSKASGAGRSKAPSRL